MKFSLIVATNLDSGIGYFENNKYTIPWNEKEDMQYFKKITLGSSFNAVIMGKNTYLSIGRPLPKRKNIVISSTLETNNDITVVKTLTDALNYCKINRYDETFVIGGSQLYKEALDHYLLNKIYWNIIHNTNKCNIYFPISLSEFLKKGNYYKTNIKMKTTGNVDYYVFNISNPANTANTANPVN